MAKKKVAKKVVKKKKRTFTETEVKEMLNDLWFGMESTLRDSAAEFVEMVRLYNVDWAIPGKGDGRTYSDEDDEDE